jgi:D-amino-acid dehydrogenase
MRIAVIGAGLAGVTTAYELALAGHETIVYERRGGIAAEGSFAPACINAPELGFALAALGPRTTLPAGAAARPIQWPWLLQAWGARRHPSPHLPQAASALAHASLARVQQIQQAHELDFARHLGVLAVFRQEAEARRLQAVLKTTDGPHEPHWVDADQARRIEPGLDDRLPLLGALHWPRGQAANGRQFAHALKAEAQRMGVRFLFHREVTGIDARASGPVTLLSKRRTELADSGLPTPTSLLSEDTSPHFDLAVICSATGGRRLLPRLHLPICAAHIHTVTAPLGSGMDGSDMDTSNASAPCGALLDLTDGISISRMGERVRVAGRARMGRSPPRPDERALREIYRGLHACFPGAARTARAQAWVGRVSLLPDGLPAVGRIGHGLWLNVAHGEHSWAWAPALAVLVARLIGGADPSVDPAPFDPARLR